MSIEAVNQFLDRVSSDRQLQAEVTQAMEAENDRLAVTQLAAKHGFEFTSEELGSQVQQTIEAQQEGELNEAELESVAGGICTPAIGIAVGVAGTAAGTAAAGLENSKKGW